MATLAQKAQAAGLQQEYKEVLRGYFPATNARFYRFGSYFGVKLLKLKNGRTVWPSVQVQ